MTSTPSQDSAAEFWAMIYRYKSGVVVMLNELQSSDSIDVSVNILMVKFKNSNILKFKNIVLIS